MNEQILENQIRLLELQVNQYKQEINNIQKENTEYSRVVQNLKGILNLEAHKYEQINGNIDELIDREKIKILEGEVLALKMQVVEIQKELLTYGQNIGKNDIAMQENYVSYGAVPPNNSEALTEDQLRQYKKSSSTTFQELQNIPEKQINRNPRTVKITPYHGTNTLQSADHNHGNEQKSIVTNKTKEDSPPSPSSSPFSFLKR
jgi:hypothetical protein